MPYPFRLPILLSLILIYAGLAWVQASASADGLSGSDEGRIKRSGERSAYYVRYDIRTSGNVLTDDHLLMVPAGKDFRAENFSRVVLSGVLPAEPGMDPTEAGRRIRDTVLKQVLMDKGLTSVSARDHDTVVGYEGMVLLPLAVQPVYNPEQKGYGYRIELTFSPIAFPDRWKVLGLKHRIKEMLKDVIQWFH